MPRARVSTGGGWRDGAKGCGIAVVVIVTMLALVGGWVVTIRPLHKAIEARETLAERYGPQDGFTPPADGAVSAERMEAFLATREQLTESCARLTEASRAIEYMESFEWVESPKRKDLLGSLWERGRSAMGLEPRRGEFWRARNEALLDAEMGLGEYTYIFVLAYSSHLVSYREEEGRVVVEDVKVLSRVRRLLLESLRRQLATVEAGPPGADSSIWAEQLAGEIARLEQDPRRIPWMEGLPAQIEASVAPSRERLDALLCEATLALELIRNEKDGLSVHGH